ncbi:MAG: hypothetical protein V7785_21895 [Bermanella sp.]
MKPDTNPKPEIQDEIDSSSSNEPSISPPSNPASSEVEPPKPKENAGSANPETPFSSSSDNDAEFKVDYSIQQYLDKEAILKAAKDASNKAIKEQQEAEELERGREATKLLRQINPYVRTARYFTSAIELPLIILIILIAIISISNISSRETLSKSIDLKIQELNAEFVSANQIVLSGELSKTNKKDIEEQLLELKLYGNLQSEIQSLINYGGHEFRLNSIQKRFVDGAPSEGTEADLISTPVFSNYQLINYLNSFTSDILLGLAVLMCAALGSAIAGLRNNQAIHPSRLTAGFATGFITYLGIKGGQFVFLLQVPGAAAVLNPYTASFIGLLSGLFSERFHMMLNHLMERAADKFNNQDQPNPDK